jgi:hypothetical protein
MQNHEFLYAGIAHHELGCGAILFKLRREDGSFFGVQLTIEDAKHLLQDLQMQVRIAAGEDT